MHKCPCSCSKLHAHVIIEKYLNCYLLKITMLCTVRRPLASNFLLKLWSSRPLAASSAPLVAPPSAPLLAPSSRGLAMWPPEFEDPVEDKEEFPSMRDSGEYDRRKLLPAKAAPNKASCSVFRDRIVDKVLHMAMKEGNKRRTENYVMLPTFNHIKVNL